MSYQLLQEDPVLFWLLFVFSFILTVFVYGLFPWVFAKTREKLITKKKYKRLCYGVNAIGMLFFIILNGASSGVPYCLWTTLFYRRGIKILGERGVMPDSEHFTPKKNQIISCTKCGHRETRYTGRCTYCGCKSLQFMFAIDSETLTDGTVFHQNCGEALAENSESCQCHRQTTNLIGNENRPGALCAEQGYVSPISETIEEPFCNEVTVAGDLKPVSQNNNEVTATFASQVMEQQMNNNEHCRKCGGILPDNHVFCPFCGKKQTRRNGKKWVKKVLKIFILSFLTIVGLSLLIGGIYSLIRYRKSYDLSTTWDRIGDGNCYVYSVSSTDGDVLTELFYMEHNHYIRLSFSESTMQVLEKGIYESTGNKVVMKDESGEMSSYIMVKGCLFGEQHISTGDVPAQRVFSQDFTYSGSEENGHISFKDDSTYYLHSNANQYSGRYIRSGCIINGISDDINGSRNWAIYNGKLIEKCYIGGRTYDSEYTQRAKYEFVKHLQLVNSKLISSGDRVFVIHYEESHPITIQ